MRLHREVSTEQGKADEVMLRTVSAVRVPGLLPWPPRCHHGRGDATALDPRWPISASSLQAAVGRNAASRSPPLHASFLVRFSHPPARRAIQPAREASPPQAGGVTLSQRTPADAPARS